MAHKKQLKEIRQGLDARKKKNPEDPLYRHIEEAHLGTAVTELRTGRKRASSDPLDFGLPSLEELGEQFEF